MTLPNFRYTTRVYPHTATLSSATDKTESIDFIGMHFIGIKFSDAFRGDKVYVNVSTDGTTFVKAFNAQGVRISIKAQAGCYVCLCPSDFVGVRYIQLESDCIEQTDRTLTLFGRVDG